MAFVIAPPAGRTDDFRRCRPLIVEPYATNRRLLRDILHGLGCAEVLDCAQVRDGMVIIERETPNLMFMDWSPRTDAIGFLRGLRSQSNPHRFLPVAVMTSYAGLNHVATARDAGANEFMLRPWSQQVVASRLRGLVLHPRLFIQGGGYFGPDRRRRRISIDGPERRKHQNWRAGERRIHDPADWHGPERRQGRPGFLTPDRRDMPRH